MKLLYTLAILTGATTYAFGANIVVNGSFELPAVTSGTASYFPSIPGWTLASGPGIELQNNFNGSAFAGLQLAEMDGEGNSEFYQDLTTTADSYVFSFAYSPRPGWAENPVQVFWNGVLLDTLNANGEGLTNTSWTVHSYNVIATGTSTRIQFAAAGVSDTFGGYVDNVSVNNVPEPASTGLCLAGLIVMLGYYRKRLFTN